LAWSSAWLRWVAISYIVEALRPAPKRPGLLDWAPDIRIQYLDLGDATVRYINTGAGPNLLLLHTLRTQLDLYEKIVCGPCQAIYRLRV